MIRTLRTRLRQASRVVEAYELCTPALEPIYRDLFVRDLRALGIEDQFYPVGAAASHGLLYLILRCLRACRFDHVLEFGAGQTTLLLDRAREALRADWSARTIEHDPYWAQAMQANCAHELRLVDLAPATVRGRVVHFYDLARLAEPAERFDFVIIDGPPGFPPPSRFSRLGAVPALERHLADEFVVVVDDSEREGEALLVETIRASLRARGAACFETQVIAAKRQHLFCSPRFRAAAYF